MSRRLILFIMLLIACSGLLLRHYSGFLGDFLWAALVYFGFAFLWVRRPVALLIASSLVFCYSIELSQLCHASWINHLRQNPVAQLVLGHGVFGFLDLLAYTLAVLLSSTIHSLCISGKTRHRSK